MALADCRLLSVSYYGSLWCTDCLQTINNIVNKEYTWFTVLRNINNIRKSFCKNHADNVLYTVHTFSMETAILL